MLNEDFEKSKAERRALLKKIGGDDSQKEEYYLMLIKKVARQTMTEKVHDGLIYQHCKVPEKVYVKSV